MRLLKRFASRVVLAFDADAAGQGAAERFYEWEQKYQVQVSVARLPGRPRPGRAGPARSRTALAAAVDGAMPFLGFRLHRVLGGQPRALAGGAGAPRRAGDGGRQRAPRRQRAQAVRRPGRQPQPACRSATCGDRRSGATARPIRRVAPAARVGSRARTPSSSPSPCSLQRWDDIAGWLDRGAVRRRRRTGGRSSPWRRADGDLDAAHRARRSRGPRGARAGGGRRRRRRSRGRGPQPDRRRRAPRAGAGGVATAIPTGSVTSRDARVALEELDDADPRGTPQRSWLLGWLHRRTAQRASGDLTSDADEPVTRRPAQLRRPVHIAGSTPASGHDLLARGRSSAARRTPSEVDPRAAPRRAHRRRARRRRSRRSPTRASASTRPVDDVDDDDTPPSGRCRRRGRRPTTRTTSACWRGAAAGAAERLRRGVDTGSTSRHGAHVPARDRPGRPADRRRRAAPGAAHRGRATRPPRRIDDGAIDRRRRAAPAACASCSAASGPRAS